eukprot:CAMPEP_0169274382 /NCGR_PEP_ID=MMETSP1016-20121227/51691_1 /TAXON_ID=342587 /ORGANISM="Karlodinium micrum, Strain CCMP2283" /LENGTH=65 /DNA_ID=CAMNT_0009360931 /DNA_START=3 /DNA_END=197 /DNA_ORIENTATION=-
MEEAQEQEAQVQAAARAMLTLVLAQLRVLSQALAPRVVVTAMALPAGVAQMATETAAAARMAAAA